MYKRKKNKLSKRGKKKYIERKLKELGLGGLIGTGVGLAAGIPAGNPALGAKMGGMAGKFVEGQVTDEEQSQPQPKANYASSSYGYANGGQLPNEDPKLPSEQSRDFDGEINKLEGKVRASNKAQGQLGVALHNLEVKLKKGEIDKPTYERARQKLRNMMKGHGSTIRKAESQIPKVKGRKKKGAQQKPKVKALLENVRNKRLNDAGNMGEFAYGGEINEEDPEVGTKFTTARQDTLPRQPRTSSEIQKQNYANDVALKERIRRMKGGDYSMVGDSVQADTVDVPLGTPEVEYARGGALPGVKPLPQGGQKFEGPKHEQGGIPIDETGNPNGKPVAEVEGGETEQDGYVFSDRLTVPKTNGKTFAEVHEMMLERGAEQQDIKKLAMMQEKVQQQQGAPGGDEQTPQRGKEGGYVNGGPLNPPDRNWSGTSPSMWEKGWGARRTSPEEAGKYLTYAGRGDFAKEVYGNRQTKKIMDRGVNPQGRNTGSVMMDHNPNIKPSPSKKSKFAPQVVKDINNGMAQPRGNVMMRHNPHIKSSPDQSKGGTPVDINNPGGIDLNWLNRKRQSKSKKKSPKKSLPDNTLQESTETPQGGSTPASNEVDPATGNTYEGIDASGIDYARPGRLGDDLGTYGQGEETENEIANSKVGEESEEGFGFDDAMGIAQYVIPSAMRLGMAANSKDVEKTPKVRADKVPVQSRAFNEGERDLASGYRSILADPNASTAEKLVAQSKFQQGRSDLAGKEADYRSRQQARNAQNQMRADQFNAQTFQRDREVQAKEDASRKKMIMDAITNPLQQYQANKQGKKQQIVNAILSADRIQDPTDRKNAIKKRLKALDLSDKEIQQYIKKLN